MGERYKMIAHCCNCDHKWEVSILKGIPTRGVMNKDCPNCGCDNIVWSSPDKYGGKV